MKKNCLRFFLSLGILVTLVLLPSWAGKTVAGADDFPKSTSVSATIGPITVPNAVPLQVCVDTTCVSTANLSSVTLTVSANASVTVDLPKLTTGLCSEGIGASVSVTTGETSTTVTATVSGTLPDGSSTTIVVGPVAAPPLKTINASVCAS
ncbi:MAG: hypothetical protein AB1489_30670 [Acidobacteriota bacterium]